jgi:hypothetical protein
MILKSVWLLAYTGHSHNTRDLEFSVNVVSLVAVGIDTSSNITPYHFLLKSMT